MQNEREQLTFHQTNIGMYDVLRFLLTLLVVIGHCAYYSIVTAYGGIAYSSIMAQAGVGDTKVHIFFSHITRFIYSFHMPMFFALSGALFQHGRNRSFTELMVNKAKRLIVPFFLVSTFYCIPLKYFTGYWSNSSNVLADVVIGQYLVQGNTHLWFLPTLYLEFLLFSFIRNTNTKNNLIQMGLLSVFVLCTIASPLIPVGLVSNFMKYMLWFYIGMLFERNRPKVDRHFKGRELIGVFLVWLILYTITKYVSLPTLIGKIAMKMLTVISTATWMSFLIGLCAVISRTSFKDNKIFKLIEKHSFGIYLYSDTLNYVILFAFFNICSVAAFGNEMAATLLWVMRFAVSLGMSLLVTVILQEMKSKLK